MTSLLIGEDQKDSDDFDENVIQEFDQSEINKEDID